MAMGNEKEPNRNRGKVLVIDDDILVAKSVRNLLVGNGYEVSMAQSAEEGVQSAASSDFDLVISDIRMPGQNGVQAVERIKELLRSQGRQSNFIFITGYAEDQITQYAAAFGIGEFLLKPFDSAQLLETVEREVALHRHDLQSIDKSPEILPENSVIGQWKFPGLKFVFEKPILLKETNIMGNTYYDNYITWQGEARERLLLNHPDLPQWMKLNPHIKMMTHSTHHRFFKETTFGDIVRIEATTREIKYCSFIMVFRFFNSRLNELLGEGWQRICFSNLKTNKLCPIPRLILDLIEPLQEHKAVFLQMSLTHNDWTNPSLELQDYR